MCVQTSEQDNLDRRKIKATSLDLILILNVMFLCFSQNISIMNLEFLFFLKKQNNK